MPKKPRLMLVTIVERKEVFVYVRNRKQAKQVALERTQGGAVETIESIDCEDDLPPHLNGYNRVYTSPDEPNAYVMIVKDVLK